MCGIVALNSVDQATIYLIDKSNKIRNPLPVYIYYISNSLKHSI